MTQRTVAALWPSKVATLTAETSVKRALPRRELRRIGPFVFCDHFGPTSAANMDVPAHPHVGLQTVTYLFSGAIRHTDSIGSVQEIRAGDVNWMTAGRAIVHAEEASQESGPLHGIQTWVGLPHAHRKTDPDFRHIPASSLPVIEREGATVRLLAGRLGEATAPTPTFQPLTYADIQLHPGASITLAVDPEQQLGLYVAAGDMNMSGTAIPAGVLAQLSTGEGELSLRSEGGGRAMLLGGAPLPEPTVIWWNFIVDSVAEGVSLRAEWTSGNFPKLPPR